MSARKTPAARSGPAATGKGGTQGPRREGPAPAAAQGHNGAAGRNRDGEAGRNRDGAASRDRDGMADRDRDGAAGRNREGAASRNRDGAAGRNRDGAAGRNRVGAAGRNRDGEAGRNRDGEAGRNRDGAAGRNRFGAAGRGRDRAPGGRRGGWTPEGIAEALLWILILLPPLLVSPAAKEAFRLPKLLASEWLGLASLLPLAWKLREVGRIEPADLRRPAILATLPLLLLATLGLAVTRHPLHTQQALADLWIGAACLIGWSLGLPRARLERLLGGLLIPGTLLALLGIGQFHGLWRLFQLAAVRPGERLAVTSLAGNPGDLGAYLVLPCLVAQWLLARGARGMARVLAAGALVLCLYALATTQTLAAVLAVGVGSLVLWLTLLPRRQALLAGGAAAVAALLLVAAVPPLRARVTEKARQMAAGDWNDVLTGRLDGWKAAGYMFSTHPWTGVGHGAYRAEFVPAKLALLAKGERLYTGYGDVAFANAHNELLEVGADLGLPGLAALGWGLGVLAGALARRKREGREAGAFAWAGAAALALLALAHFPFRIALVAFPALLLLAWAMRPHEEPA